MIEQNNSSADERSAWVVAAQAGDSEAFGRLYDTLVTPIFRYIFYRVATRADAEDLTEVAFLKAWERLDSYQTHGDVPFTAWLYRIAHNTVIDFYRANAKNSTLELNENWEADAAENPAQLTERSLENRDLRRAVRRLPHNYQEVLVLRFINDLSTEEVARVLGKSTGAVRILQFRALAGLRAILEGGVDTNFVPASAAA